MQTLEILDKKIKTTEDLLSVVKTMKSLAAVNIRQYEKAVTAIDAYREVVDNGWRAFFRNSRVDLGKPVNQKAVFIVIGSDQGMCGPFNESLVSFALENSRQLNDTGHDIRFWSSGERIFSGLEESGSHPDENFPAPGNLSQVIAMVQDMIKKLELWQSRETISYFYLCHNILENAGSYTPQLYSFLPLDNAWTQAIKATPWPEKCIPMLGLSEPDLFRHLFRQHLFISLYRALAHSMAAENSARLMAMQAAEKNIMEMTSDLKKSFREQRQMNITTEILDIISGFEALTPGDI